MHSGMFGLLGQHPRYLEIFASSTYNQNGMEGKENEEIIMDKKELVISLGQLQGLKIVPARALNMSGPGGV